MTFTVTITVIRGLIAAAAALSVAGNIAIWRDTWRWEATGTRPVAASWAEWAALTGAGSAAAWQAGQMPAAVYGACCAAGCAVVVPLALRIPAAGRDAPARLGQARLDVVLLPATLAGLMLLITPLTTVGHGWIRTPGPAVAVSVATDALAYLPTAVHAWRHPESEPWQVYGLFGAGAALSLAAVALQGQMLDLTAAAYPLYLTAADLGVVAVIVARRNSAAEPEPEDPGPAVREILAGTWPPVATAWAARQGEPWPEDRRQAAVGDVIGLLARDLEVHHLTGPARPSASARSPRTSPGRTRSGSGRRSAGR